MRLGIPTLNRYDLLDRLLRTLAWESDELPTHIDIIDNGGGYEQTRLRQIFSRVSKPPVLVVHHPGRNLGVAGAWNQLLRLARHDTPTPPVLGGFSAAVGRPVTLDLAEPLIISNDDLVFEPNTFSTVAEHLRKGAHFVGAAGGWALFGQSPECTRRVGFYDERFYPAYFEDCDYLLRLDRAGITPTEAGWLVREHEGEASTKGASQADQELIAEGRTRGYAYFIAKWGADSPRWTGPRGKHFEKPFDGQLVSPELRRDEIAPLRWEVLDTIARLNGAKRYLEIGVSDGNNLRRLASGMERWGVDPHPHTSGVAAADFFFGHSADEFWARYAGAPFDLVFIDGDHRAEQVLRDVAGAKQVLAPGGVIVLHDASPHTEEMQAVPFGGHGWAWTGDVWKAIVELRRQGEHLHVIPSDFGIAVLVPGRKDKPRKLPKADSYAELEASRHALLGTVPVGTWQKWLTETLARGPVSAARR